MRITVWSMVQSLQYWYYLQHNASIHNFLLNVYSPETEHGIESSVPGTVWYTMCQYVIFSQMCIHTGQK